MPLPGDLKGEEDEAMGVEKFYGIVGAGDRDRTGDVQLGNCFYAIAFIEFIRLTVRKSSYNPVKNRQKRTPGATVEGADCIKMPRWDRSLNESFPANALP